MKDIFARESRHDGHKNADSYILALLSHGNLGKFYGTDSKPVDIENDIKEAFDGKHCPFLARKPKLIIIQACQGSECKNLRCFYQLGKRYVFGRVCLFVCLLKILLERIVMNI